MRPRHDRQRRAALTRLRDDLAAVERVRYRDQDAARGFQIGGPDDVGIGAVAGDRLRRLALEFLALESLALEFLALEFLALDAVHPVDVLLDHQQRRSGLEQLLADEA